VAEAVEQQVAGGAGSLAAAENFRPPWKALELVDLRDRVKRCRSLRAAC
jgi:hypothetical protein